MQNVTPVLFVNVRQTWSAIHKVKDKVAREFTFTRHDKQAVRPGGKTTLQCRENLSILCQSLVYTSYEMGGP